MAKKKIVPDSATAERSRNVKRKAIQNMKALNAKLLKEFEEHQKEIEQVHQQMGLAMEQLELTAAEINEVNMQFLIAAEEKHALQRELNLILQQRDLSCPEKAQGEKLWWKNKKWIYPTVAVSAILFASTVVTLCTKSSKLRK